MIAKDDSINRLLSRLPLANRGWKVVDHWEADLCAIGIASDRAPGKLVYISTFDTEPGKYDFECELSHSTQEADDFEVARSGEDVDFTALEAALAEWLRPEGDRATHAA